MAIIVTGRKTPMPLNAARRVRNGIVASHNTPLAIAQQANFITTRCRKVAFIKALAGVDPAAFAVTTNLWRFRFHSGLAASDLTLVAKFVCVAPCFPQMVLNGTTLGDQVYVGGTSDDFEDLHVRFSSIAIDPDTDYECLIRVIPSFGSTTESKPPVSVTVWEIARGGVDTADAVAVDSRKFFAKAQIYDAPHQDLASALHDLYLKNGRQLFSWAPDLPSLIPTITSATYTNLLDVTSTAVTANTPGFNLDLEYLVPYHASTVKATLAVFAGAASGSPVGGVAIYDSGGLVGEVTGFTAAFAWHTASISIDSTDPKVDIMFKSNGSVATDVHAVCLYLEG